MFGEVVVLEPVLTTTSPKLRACGQRRRRTRSTRQAFAVRSAHRPAVLEGCVFRSRDVLADGVLTPAALRTSAWRRLYRGVYADARLGDSVGLRIRGAALIAPPDAVFTGRTAAYLHGATELSDLRAPVEITVPRATSFGPVTGFAHPAP